MTNRRRMGDLKAYVHCLAVTRTYYLDRLLTCSHKTDSLSPPWHVRFGRTVYAWWSRTLSSFVRSHAAILGSEKPAVCVCGASRKLLLNLSARGCLQNSSYIIAVIRIYTLRLGPLRATLIHSLDYTAVGTPLHAITREFSP